MIETHRKSWDKSGVEGHELLICWKISCAERMWVQTRVERAALQRLMTSNDSQKYFITAHASGAWAGETTSIGISILFVVKLSTSLTAHASGA